MIKVFLHGSLGKQFGRKWELDAQTPSQVFKAIDANKEGLVKYLLKKEKEGVIYRIFFDKKPIKGQELDIDISSKKEMHVFPIIKGSDTKEAQEKRKIGAITLGGGWVLSKTGGWLEGFGGFWGGFGSLISFTGDIAFEIGAALLIQGIIGSFMDEPENPDPGNEKQLRSSTSFVFQNPANNVLQGARVPIGYGRLRVGSHVISSSVLNSRLVTFNPIVVEENKESSTGAPKEVVSQVVANDRLVAL
jgi:predicted phage tail protein